MDNEKLKRSKALAYAREKRYLATKKGKLAKKKAAAKSQCKKYIREIATLKDLEIVQGWINERIGGKDND